MTTILIQLHTVITGLVFRTYLETTKKLHSEYKLNSKVVEQLKELHGIRLGEMEFVDLNGRPKGKSLNITYSAGDLAMMCDENHITLMTSRFSKKDSRNLYKMFKIIHQSLKQDESK